jgi:hypothetical protein
MGGLGRRLLVPTNGRTIRGHVKGRQGWPRAGLGVIAGLVGYPSSSIARGKQRWQSSVRRRNGLAGCCLYVGVLYVVEERCQARS